MCVYDKMAKSCLYLSELSDFQMLGNQHSLMRSRKNQFQLTIIHFVPLIHRLVLFLFQMKDLKHFLKSDYNKIAVVDKRFQERSFIIKVAFFFTIFFGLSSFSSLISKNHLEVCIKIFEKKEKVSIFLHLCYITIAGEYIYL